MGEKLTALIKASMKPAQAGLVEIIRKKDPQVSRDDLCFGGEDLEDLFDKEATEMQVSPVVSSNTWLALLNGLFLRVASSCV